jgi:hypothetical protein
MLAWRLGVFARLAQELVAAFECGGGFAQLAADGDRLIDRRAEQAEEHRVGDEAAERHRAGGHGVGADVDHGDGGGAEEQGGGHGHPGVLAQHAAGRVEQAVHAGGEGAGFRLLGAVGFHHPHAAERFGEAAADTSELLALQGVRGTQALQRSPELIRKGGEQRDDDERDRHVQVEQHEQRDHRGQDGAGEIDQAAVEEIADGVDVVDDARDERAGAGGVVEGGRQARDVGLHAQAEVGDDLAGLACDEGVQQIGAAGLRERGGAHDGHDRQQPVGMRAAEHAIEEIAHRERHHELRQAVHEHGDESGGDQSAPGSHQLPRDRAGRTRPLSTQRRAELHHGSALLLMWTRVKVGEATLRRLSSRDAGRGRR